MSDELNPYLRENADGSWSADFWGPGGRTEPDEEQSEAALWTPLDLTPEQEEFQHRVLYRAQEIFNGEGEPLDPKYARSGPWTWLGPFTSYDIAAEVRDKMKEEE